MAIILEDLAAGRIDAAEAARQIDTVSATREPARTSPTTAAEEGVSADAWALSTDRPQVAGHATEAVRTPENSVPAETLEESAPEPQIKVRSTNGVERISIRAIGRRVRIVGEPSVATVSADGPHVLRRNGSVLEISSDGELGPSIDGFQILRGAPRTLEDFRSLGLGKELFLRVNPAIPIDIEVTAGSLHTERVPRLGNVRVTAGGAKMQDVTQVSDALIQAGQATITGTITQGRSRIRAESGSVIIQLSDDSDVTVTSEAQLGKVTWGGRHSGAGDEVVMGDGRGKLTVEVLMAHASVKVGSEPATSGAGR